MSWDDPRDPPDGDDRTRVVPSARRRASSPHLRSPEQERRAPAPDRRPAEPSHFVDDSWAIPRAPTTSQAPTPRAQPQAPASDGPDQGQTPVPVLADRRSFIAANANPLLQLASPLLVTLGGLRTSLIDARPSELMPSIARAIQDFETEVMRSAVDPEQGRIAKYILCAMADDIVQNLPGDQHVWTQYSMLSQFFGERDSGVQFFKMLDRLKQDPARNYDLLELQHACLSIGFEGQFRSGAQGQRTLQQLQRNLYETLRRVRRPKRALSPHWEGEPIEAYRGGFEVPVWAVSAAFGVLLFAVYLVLRMLLSNATGTVLAAASPLLESGDMTIQRRVFVPPPPPPPPSPPQMKQLARVRAALADELRDNKVRVQQTADRIIVHLGSFGLFASGDAKLEPGFRDINTHITPMLDREIGPIRITGNTDNSPIKGIRFESNYDLSLARANAVASVLRRTLREPNRLKIEGRGPDEPVATNDTPDGRALNRRVDISIQRVD